MNKKNKKKNRGFALLFAITISSIIFLVAMEVVDIAIKEAQFSTSATDTNNAFFATDTGAECALYNDKSAINAFPVSTTDPMTGLNNTPAQPSQINCPNPVDLGGSFEGGWSFTVNDLGSLGVVGCAKVTVAKGTDNNNVPFTTITSLGYNSNDCSATNNKVERKLIVQY